MARGSAPLLRERDRTISLSDSVTSAGAGELGRRVANTTAPEHQHHPRQLQRARPLAEDEGAEDQRADRLDHQQQRGERGRQPRQRDRDQQPAEHLRGEREQGQPAGAGPSRDESRVAARRRRSRPRRSPRRRSRRTAARRAGAGRRRRDGGAAGRRRRRPRQRRRTPLRPSGRCRRRRARRFPRSESPRAAATGSATITWRRGRSASSSQATSGTSTT